MTSLTIALLDVRSTGAASLGGRLQSTLADSGTNARVTTFDAVAADFDASGFDAFFLRGLQVPGTSDVSIEAADSALRAALFEAGINYQVIYGGDEEFLKQTRQLVHAIENRGAVRPVSAAEPNQKARDPDGSSPWVWMCDKCSDAQCEHRLLTDLLKQRQTPSPS